MVFVSTFISGESSLLVGKFFSSSSHSSFKNVFLLPPANLRMVRTLTFAAASSSSSSNQATTPLREPRGIRKPQRISPEMQALVGAPEIPRTQALKVIWAHIKEHNLQDPNDKKTIICDEKLKKIFGGRDQVRFLEIAGLISPHFIK